MLGNWTKMAIGAIAVMLFALAPSPAFSQTIVIKGHVTDPKGNDLPKVVVRLLDGSSVLAEATTGSVGQFELSASAGQFVIKVDASGFRPVTRIVRLRPQSNSAIEIRMGELSTRGETIIVTADVTQGDVLSPDPAVKVFAAVDLLDANPGRPGAPISIPGYPIETASGGIKAPQYFAPGVAGDHGEPN
jgi:hypothetical protein